MLQDLGFLAFTLPQVDILMPTKKPRGQELTGEQQLANQALVVLKISGVSTPLKFLKLGVYCMDSCDLYLQSENTL